MAVMRLPFTLTVSMSHQTADARPVRTVPSIILSNVVTELVPLFAIMVALYACHAVLYFVGERFCVGRCLRTTLRSGHRFIRWSLAMSCVYEAPHLFSH